MPLKPKIIYNPAAGKGSAGKQLAKVEAMLRERRFEYDLVLTAGPGHAQALGQQAAEEGRELVIAAGGDGTVNETINGLMQARIRMNGAGHTHPALGVLPVGRGNDFAFGAGIPVQLGAACDTLIQGRRQTIDLGYVEVGDDGQGRYFGNGVGLGFDTVVGFEAARITWLQGAASYLVGVIKAIFLYARAPVYEVVYDDGMLSQPFLMVSVMNGRRMGGAFLMTPESQPGDGLFDLCLTGQVSQVRILPLAMKFLDGSQVQHPAVSMARAQQVRVRALQGSIPAHADGETLCVNGQALSIRLCRGALEVLSSTNGGVA